jgi:uracil-DNA glycosylase family 4
VLVLGSAPGPEDAKVGKAWQSGEAVEEVRVWLAHLGLSDPHKVWWSYLTRCPMKRTIKAAEVKACRPFLEQELAFLPDVRVILPLGAVARKAILGAADAVAMTEPSEAVVEHAGRQLHVYPLPSPNYFARSPEERRYHLASVLPEVKKALQTLGVV